MNLKWFPRKREVTRKQKSYIFCFFKWKKFFDKKKANLKKIKDIIKFHTTVRKENASPLRTLYVPGNKDEDALAATV